MAGAATYTVVLDANVLYPIYTCDLIMSLSVTRLFHARWTKDIEDEAKRNLKLKLPPAMSRKIPTRFKHMRAAIPDCIIENYQPLIGKLKLPDPDDRHVLAAAIVGHADAIVTFNLKDFPKQTVGKFNIEVIHPDDFVMNQIELNQVACLTAIKDMREKWNNPARSAQDLVNFYCANQLTQTGDFLRSAIHLI